MAAELVVTGTAFLGLALYYWEELCIIATRAKGIFLVYISGIKRQEIEEKRRYKVRNPVQLMSRLIAATIGLSDNRITYGLFVFSGLSALFVFLVFKRYLDAGLLIALSAFTAVLPALLLICRLQVLRIKSSLEGEILLTELLDNYKINYYNMHQAIEVTAFTIKEAPGSKRLLFNLSKGLNTASGPEEIRNLLKDFEFALGTSWATVMTDNMYFALVSGIRVTAAMEDLVSTLSQARKVSEYAKRENNESGLILKYMVPVCYILTVVAAIQYFGLTIDEYVTYQFMTSAGMGWFVISMLMYIAGIFMNFFLSKNKLDL